MKRTLAALLLLALCSAAALAQKDPPPPDYFPLPAEAWWKYRSTTQDGKQSEFTLRVLGVEDQEDGSKWVKVATEASWQTIHDYYTKPPGWVLMHRQVYTSNGMSADYDPVKQYLQNPLGKGATWAWKGKGMMGVDISESNEVAGAEAVTVPAGKFSAMKVVTRVNQGGTDVLKTYWFTDHVGMVKSMTDSGSVKSTTELVDYSFKKK